MMRQGNCCIDCGKPLPEHKGRGRASPRCEVCWDENRRTKNRARQRKQRDKQQKATYTRRLEHAKELWAQGVSRCCVEWYLSSNYRGVACPQHRTQETVYVETGKAKRNIYGKGTEQYMTIAQFGAGGDWGVEDKTKMKETDRAVRDEKGWYGKPPEWTEDQYDQPTIEGVTKFVGAPEGPQRERDMKLVEPDINVDALMGVEDMAAVDEADDKHVKARQKKMAGKTRKMSDKAMAKELASQVKS